ncbi:MAG: ThiJ/PfpI family protein [Polaromonas sp.]|nr:ThiJ/PfpI family protein [Polaromonas sp.]
MTRHATENVEASANRKTCALPADRGKALTAYPVPSCAAMSFATRFPRNSSHRFLAPGFCTTMCASLAHAPSAPSFIDFRPQGPTPMNILMLLTLHDQLGNTGKKTGFWLEEFAAP